jgi:hypothetical protein
VLLKRPERMLGSIGAVLLLFEKALLSMGAPITAGDDEEKPGWSRSVRPASRNKEERLGLPTHYLFAPIPVG